MGRALIRALVRLHDALCAVALVAMFSVGVYGVIDAQLVEGDAKSASWVAYKPLEPDFVSFSHLVEQNPDVVGWVSIYGCGIDYPVCQSDDVTYYLDHDALRNESLAGSLFLEPQARSDFSEAVTFVFGHHMDKHLMFGDVDLFCDQKYLESHRYGNLFFGGLDHGVELIGCLDADAYDESVYAVGSDVTSWLATIRDRAVSWVDVNVASDDRLVALSTCSAGTTSGRHVLVGVIRDEVFDDPFVEWPNTGTGVGAQDLSWRLVLGVAVVVSLAVLIFDFVYMRAKSHGIGA